MTQGSVSRSDVIRLPLPTGDALKIGGAALVGAGVGTAIGDFGRFFSSNPEVSVPSTAIRTGAGAAIAMAECLLVSRLHFSEDGWVATGQGAAVGAALGISNVLTFGTLVGVRAGVHVNLRKFAGFAALGGAVLGAAGAALAHLRND